MEKVSLVLQGRQGTVGSCCLSEGTSDCPDAFYRITYQIRAPCLYLQGTSGPHLEVSRGLGEGQ